MDRPAIPPRLPLSGVVLPVALFVELLGAVLAEFWLVVIVLPLLAPPPALAAPTVVPPPPVFAPPPLEAPPLAPATTVAAPARRYRS